MRVTSQKAKPDNPLPTSGQKQSVPVRMGTLFIDVSPQDPTTVLGTMARHSPCSVLQRHCWKLRPSRMKCLMTPGRGLALWPDL